jgi:hypothetical protein
MAGYIGTGAVPQATQKRDSFTATAGQTSFPTSGYTPGFVDVYMNGVKLAPADFTATNSSDVVLAVAAVANDTLEIISFSTFEISSRTFTGDVTASGGTFLPTGDTSAGDAAAMGYAAADGLVLTGQGSTSDVTIKNDADATVMSIPTGTTGVTFAGTPTFPDGSINIADLDIDGGTDIGAALVDADLMVVDDGAGGTNRKATMSRLATYMGTKIGGGLEFIVSSGAISNAANVSFTQFDASKYDHYVFSFKNVIPATDGVRLFGYHSADGGSSYDTTDGEYHRAGNGDSTGFQINYTAQELGSAANEFGVSGLAFLYAPSAASFTIMNSVNIVSQGVDGGIYGSYSTDNAVTARIAAEATTAIKFAMDSGNIESGEIDMFGIVNS